MLSNTTLTYLKRLQVRRQIFDLGCLGFNCDVITVHLVLQLGELAVLLFHRALGLSQLAAQGALVGLAVLQLSTSVWNGNIFFYFSISMQENINETEDQEEMFLLCRPVPVSL